MKRLLFVCTANACRSQMAEALARHHARDRFAVCSAGIRPAPLDPLAVEVMREHGMDIARHRPKGIETVRLNDMFLIVTLSEYAMMKLPAIPLGIHRLHWNIVDPSAARSRATMSLYRTVRDDLESRINRLLAAMDALPVLPQEPQHDRRAEGALPLRLAELSF